LGVFRARDQKLVFVELEGCDGASVVTDKITEILLVLHVKKADDLIKASESHQSLRGVSAQDGAFCGIERILSLKLLKVKLSLLVIAHAQTQQPTFISAQ
jgi:hypothetical protein